MRNFPEIDTSSPPRISQIDCLPQNRLDPEKFEQTRRQQKIDEHKKEIMSQTAALKAQSYGRRRADYSSGVLPPISQISMGGRQLPAENKVPTEGLKLPPISQVSCLGGYVDDKNLLIKPTKPRIRAGDSDFIKLSKSSGQKDLLCYSEAHVKSGANETDAGNAYPRSTRYVLGFTSEADPRWKPSHWSDFTRQRPARHGDTRLVWR